MTSVYVSRFLYYNIRTYRVFAAHIAYMFTCLPISRILSPKNEPVHGGQRRIFCVREKYEFNRASNALLPRVGEFHFTRHWDMLSEPPFKCKMAVYKYVIFDI